MSIETDSYRATKYFTLEVEEPASFTELHLSREEGCVKRNLDI